MKNLAYLLILASLLLMAPQCEEEADSTARAEFSCDESPATCQLTAANGDFAIALFKQLNGEEPDKNIFISPFSISTALTMTANGAGGQTIDDMRSTLKLGGLEMQAVNTSFRQLLEVLPALDPQTKLKLANSIWTGEGFPALESFLEINKTFFNSQIMPVNFGDPNVVAKVNKWVEENTDGLIKETLQQLPPDVVMLLINAIYFKGTWQTEFDPENTFQADFNLADGATAPVDMMHILESNFPYFQTDLFQAIDLPYGDSIYSMTVLLPNEGHSVGEIVGEMSPATWGQWLNAFQTRPVQLYLPKFKMEYGKGLKRTLSDMGMGVAFGGGADFSRMFAGGGVKIDEVIHKAFVEVNEEGTEAAAVTVIIMTKNGSGPVPTFRADHPFVFVIRDNKTNSILFMGKMMTPAS